MASGFNSQVAGFLSKAEERHEKLKELEKVVDGLCDGIQSILFVIGSSGDTPLTESDLKKLMVPREAEGSVKHRVDYLSRGLALVKKVVMDYTMATAALSTKISLTSADGSTLSGNRGSKLPTVTVEELKGVHHNPAGENGSASDSRERRQREKSREHRGTRSGSRSHPRSSTHKSGKGGFLNAFFSA
jgi:hypothetical protein